MSCVHLLPDLVDVFYSEVDTSRNIHQREKQKRLYYPGVHGKTDLRIIIMGTWFLDTKNKHATYEQQNIFK